MSRYGRRLTPEEARELRILRVTTRATIPVLAELYGISETSARDIVRGRSYRDAGGPADDVTPAGRAEGVHGTSARYGSGCRCPDCMQANRIRCREYRRMRKADQLLERIGDLLGQMELTAGALRDVLAVSRKKGTGKRGE